MKISEMLKKHYKELSPLARKVIAESDQAFNEFVGTVESVEEFNLFVELNYR